MRVFSYATKTGLYATQHNIIHYTLLKATYLCNMTLYAVAFPPPSLSTGALEYRHPHSTALSPIYIA
jgi:hypothetical protein